jgi:hypothetical protein
MLHVATRKGLLSFEETAGGWTLQRTAFIGEPLSAVLADPRDGTLYAALNLGHFGVKLHRSDDGGATWKELAPPAYPAAGDGEGPSLSLIWTLCPGGTDQPGTIWAGTAPGGLFRSDDRGESWSLNEALWNVPSRPEWFGGGYDQPAIHSILVDPRDSGRLTIGVSCAGAWLSDDGGASWRAGTGMRAEFMPPEKAYEPTVQDPHRLASCRTQPDRVWCQHHNGIFRSDDRGATFAEIKTARPSAFGFAVAVHPDDPDTAWFVPAVKDECRIPVDRRLVVSRTRDGGESFEALSEGLPPAPAFDLVYRHGLDVDATGERLAMGSTTGGLWVGDKGGERWRLVSSHLPPIVQVAWAD